MSDRTRSIALAVLVLVAAAGTNVAGASSHDAQIASNDGPAAASGHAHVHVDVHADPDGVYVTAVYEGNGTATLTVEGVDAPYRDGGTWEIDGERSFEFAYPERADRVRVLVEAPRGTVEQVVSFETVTLACGGVERSYRLPTAVAYEVRVDGETRASSREEVAIPDVECPEPPVERGELPEDALDASALYERADEQLHPSSVDLPERPDPAAESGGENRTDDRDRPEDDAALPGEESAVRERPPLPSEAPLPVPPVGGVDVGEALSEVLGLVTGGDGEVRAGAEADCEAAVDAGGDGATAAASCEAEAGGTIEA